MTRPNILLLFSDEHSFRFMGHCPESEGGEPVRTPNFDRLAAQGTVFTDAYCQMPLCTPSRISMLTGRLARDCGAWANESVLRPELPTLPGLLRDSGYATCLVGKMHLGGRQQFVGFQHRPYGDLTGKAGHQRETMPRTVHGMRARTCVEVGETLIPESLLQDQVVAHESVAFLREQAHRRPEQPWFLCAGFSRPHFPLTAPRRHLDRYWPNGVTEPRVPAGGDAYDHPMSVGMRKGFQAEAISRDEMMRARGGYFANVSYMDEIVGEMLLRLEHAGLLENTVIIYTTDHGEMAGEHGVWWKNGWYEACTRVPLIFSLPQQRRGEQPAGRCRTPVGLVDLLPTLAGLAGLPVPDWAAGADLSPTLTTGAPAPDRPIFCDALTPRWGAGTEFRMIRQGRYKVVRFRKASPLAFDVQADPGEQHNLYQRLPEIPAEARRLAALAESSMDFDAAEQERLRDQALAVEYRQDVPKSTGNLYLMPNNTLVNAEDTLYSPTVIADTPEKAFGANWQEQNHLP